MILKQSIHFKDAQVQLANMSLARCVDKYKNKWDITSTLVHVYKGGCHAPYYLDSKGDVVCYSLTKTPTDYVKIGEVLYTEESIEVNNE